MSNKNNTIGLIVVGIIAIIGVFTPLVKSISSSFGAVGGQLIEQYVPYVLYNGGINTALPISATAGITLGASGSSLSKIIAPTNCTVIASANTIAASSTKDVDCAITGIVSGDDVQVTATTSLSSAFLGVDIIAEHASTTPGFATFTLSNGTGTTFTWTSQASTSVSAFVLK